MQSHTSLLENADAQISFIHSDWFEGLAAAIHGIRGQEYADHKQATSPQVSAHMFAKADVTCKA